MTNKNLSRKYDELVLLLDGYFKGEALCQTLLNSPDFKARIDFEAARINTQTPSPSQTSDVTQEDDELDESMMMRLIIAGDFDDGKDALKEIRDWLKGAEHIILCDPYLLHGPRSGVYKSEDDYVEHINRLIPRSAKNIKIFASGYTTTLKKKISAALKDGRIFSIIDTNEIHDRYIIRDKSVGKLIGTSFGGIGNKISTVLDLPKNDVVVLERLLHEIQTT